MREIFIFDIDIAPSIINRSLHHVIELNTTEVLKKKSLP